SMALPSPCGWACIPGQWLWVKWAVVGDTSTSPWGKRPTLQRAFVLEALGTQTLKGITAPMGVWRVVSPLETLREAALPAPEDVKPLVGRSEELGLLLRRWEQGQAGRGQVVLISGGAGAGK